MKLFFQKQIKIVQLMFIDILLQYQLQKQCHSNDESAFLYNIYQLYYIYPNDLDYKFQFMNYFIKKNNKKGSRLFFKFYQREKL